MARKKRKGRNISGILLLDKPAGITSNRVLQTVKAIYQAQKAGHTGSLDPLATGMLPICFGEATKVSAYLLDADKRYRLACRLGQRTATGDAEGEVVEERPVPALDESRLQEVLQGFLGEIEQIPPMYSALKHQGERLYNLARQGVEVERKPRLVRIYEIKLIDYKDNVLELEVACSKGTYVRTLAEDIGEKLGCGAHIIQLRRLTVGPFTDPGQMVSLETLDQERETGTEALDRHLLPMEMALEQWPDVRLNPDMAYYLKQGQPVLVPKAPKQGWVRLWDNTDTLIGMGMVLDDGRIAPKRLFRPDSSRGSHQKASGGDN